MNHFFQQEFRTTSGKIIANSQKPYLILELGLNHNRDKATLKEMVERAGELGADAVKLQSYTTEKFINKDYEKCRGLFDIFAGLELSLEMHALAKETAQKCGIDFFSTPLSVDWVDKLADLKTEFFKIASGDLNNYELLQACLAHNHVPLIISTGAAKLTDIERTAAFMHFNGKRDVIFLHCVSLYPTPNNKANIARVQTIQKLTGAVVGFSDHTAGSTAAFAAVSAGARIIEKHYTLDQNMPGPDQKISANPAMIKDLRAQIDLAFEIAGEGKDSHPEEFNADFYGKRALYPTSEKLHALRPRDPDFTNADEYFSELHKKNQ